MEKYRKFADAKYGINPFVPSKSKTTNKALKYTLGPILLLLRLPFVIYLFGALYLYHALLKKIIVVKSIQTGVTAIVENVIYKIIGILCGFYDYKMIPKSSNKPKLESGHIVLCNHTHPLDFLYFAQVCSPTFVKMYTKTSSSGEKEVLFQTLDYSSTLKYFLTSKLLPSPVQDQDSTELLSISQLAQRSYKDKEGPIVVFFEGAITNGKGVLDMYESLAYEIYEYQKETNRDTVVTALTYEDNADATVSHPIVATLSFLMNISNQATVRISRASNLPIQRKDMPRTIYDIYENFHRIPKMALRSEDYQAFLEYWRATQKKNYVAKDEKAKKDL